MNTVKHAPAKWFLTMREMKEGDHHAEITLSKDSGFAEDSDEYMRVSGICSVANAKLIAAAPELLAACQAYMELFKNSDMRPEDETHEMANVMIAAIKKATE